MLASYSPGSIDNLTFLCFWSLEVFVDDHWYVLLNDPEFLFYSFSRLSCGSDVVLPTFQPGKVNHLIDVNFPHRGFLNLSV